MIGQYILLLIFGLCGIIIGIITSICYLVRTFTHDNYVVRLILDMLTVISISILLMYVSNVYCMGIIRLYLMASTAVTYYIYSRTLGKMFAKMSKKLYNAYSNWIKQVKTTKLAKQLFK